MKKLMSLALALAMLCAFVPAVHAAGEVTLTVDVTSYRNAEIEIYAEAVGAEGAYLCAAAYSEDGNLIEAKEIVDNEARLSCVGAAKIKVFCWKSKEDMTPLCDAYEENISLLEYVERVNDYWIATHKSLPSYWWDEAAYYNGNMDAYFMTGIEEYRDYAERWAEKNDWMGDPKSSNLQWENYDVYFADNQTCFQTYIDLYNLDPEKDAGKIARALAVADRQISEGTTSFWTWCDALYMAMPYFTKLYTLTGDEKYIDAMYDYFTYAKSIMYDGEGGIRQNGERVNLFYRDAGYVGSTYLGEKNIWARGTGWVMAALAKTLDEVPKDWEHYNDLKKVFLEMSASCRKYAKTDSEGRKYYTQSIIPMYPVSAQNPQGYETSGTAFITYALYLGINSGLLSEDEYLPTAEGGLRYLLEVAIGENGHVGYVQQIGSDAVNATTEYDSYNFGVGGTLSALCEAERFYHGAGDDIYPYLVKKTVGAAALKIGSGNIFSDGSVETFKWNTYISASGAMLPARALAKAFGAEYLWYGSTKKAVITLDGVRSVFVAGEEDFLLNGASVKGDCPAEITDGELYIPVGSAAKAFGRRIYQNEEEGIIVLGRHETAFYDCDKGAVKLLSEILESGEIPQRPNHPSKDFTFEDSGNSGNNGNNDIDEFKNPNRIKIVSAVASRVPETNNSIENAFDDNLETYWGIDGYADEGVFDLGDSVHIEKIALAFRMYDIRQTKFELLVSEDGDDYESFFNGYSGIENKFTYVDIGRTARYIKVIGYGNTMNMWTSLLEIVPFSAYEDSGDSGNTDIDEFKNPNRIKIDSAVASRVPEPENSIENAFDDSLVTYWGIGGYGDEGVFDLGDSVYIEKIALAFRMYNVRQTKFELLVSDDGEDYESFFDGYSETENRFTYVNIGRTARYIKVIGYGNTTNEWTSLLEIVPFSA